MSVLACDRVGCENVMCDRYSLQRQEYLCNECFESLVSLGPGVSIDKFMAGGYREDNVDLETSRDYFDKKFPLDRQE